MAQQFKNEAEKDRAFHIASISIRLILYVTVVLFLFMAYKTFFK